jgi:hypothetical protein
VDDNSNKEKFDKENLLTKLNSHAEDPTAPGATRFLDVEKIGDGRYTLTVQMDGTTFDKTFKPATKEDNNKNKKHGFVVPLSRSNPLLKRKELEQEGDNLKLQLENAYVKDVINNQGKELAGSSVNLRYRDKLDPQYLDARPETVDISKPKELYRRSETEYYRNGIYGTVIDILTNLSVTGFYNEIEDSDIKDHFDSWTQDINFVGTVRKIFHDLFKYSVCYVMNTKDSYSPNPDGISSIPGKIPSKKKSKAGMKADVARVLNQIMLQTTGQPMDYNKFSVLYDSKEFGASSTSKEVPVGYTIIDPKNVDIDAPGFFDGYSVTLTTNGLKSLKAFMKAQDKKGKDMSKSVKAAFKLIPEKLKKAAETNVSYTFNDDEIDVIHLRKEDFEAYSKPRGARAFDTFDYKDELKKADYATLDGIYNYILKITIGDKDNPVTDVSVFDTLAETFNTPQKAFAIIWNHTLKIEKITSPEVSNILGKVKYEPVEADIAASLGIARALVDGTNINNEGAILSTKSLQSEINAARAQVEAWIYRQYRMVAKAAGFSAFPVVKWKESVINTDSDAVTRASYMQMLDRKAISVQSYMREMGLDYESEIQKLKEELPLVQEDVLRAGSPYQGGVMSGPGGNKPQEPIPVTISGDSGRPKGQPAGKKSPVNKTKVVKQKTQVKSPSQASATEIDRDLVEELTNASPDQVEDLLLSIKPNETSNIQDNEVPNTVDEEISSQTETLKDSIEE